MEVKGECCKEQNYVVCQRRDCCGDEYHAGWPSAGGGGSSLVPKDTGDGSWRSGGRCTAESLGGE